MNGLKTLSHKIAGVLFGIALALSIAECLLRLFPHLMPVAAQIRHRAESEVKIDREVWIPDSYLGYKLPPNLDTLLEAFPEEPYRVRTTSLGYDDIGFRSAPRDGRPAAALVGDSFTFAEGVSQEDSWATQLAGRTGWNVLNFGLNGYGPPQYTRMLTRYALPLKPGLVLWVFCPNDFGNAYDFHAAIEQGKGAVGYRWRRQRSRLARAGDAAWTALRDHSFACDSLSWAIHAWKQGASVTIRTEHVQFATQWDYWGPLIALHDERIHKGWLWTQEDLLEARNAARAAGAEFVVVIIPFREQVYWHLLQGKLPGWGDENPDGPGNLVGNFCAANNIRALDLAPAFREAAQRGDEQLYFSGDGHWNPAGNRFVANTIADFLKAEGLLPARPPITGSEAFPTVPAGQ